MATGNPLLLLDTASLYYRAYFGVPETLRAPDGTPVNAVRGLLDTIARLVTITGAHRIVACWDDDWRPAFRVELIPSYKAHRVAGAVGAASPSTVADQTSPSIEETPDTLAPQVPIIAAVLEAMGIARIGRPGLEADDVIGTLATREASRPPADRSDVVVVTGDRDLFQLIDDAAGVRVFVPTPGQSEPIVMDQAALDLRYGVPTGSAYVEMSMLRGDPSDGLPGVKGIGEKTATALITTFGSLAAIRDAAANADKRLTVVQRQRIIDAAAYLDVAPRVVRVVTDAPIPPVDDAVPIAPRDATALAALVEQWGIGGSVDRLAQALGWPGSHLV